MQSPQIGNTAPICSPLTTVEVGYATFALINNGNEGMSDYKVSMRYTPEQPYFVDWIGRRRSGRPFVRDDLLQTLDAIIRLRHNIQCAAHEKFGSCAYSTFRHQSYQHGYALPVSNRFQTLDAL